MDTITEAAPAKIEPPLCITCAHIGTNASIDWTRYRCFAPQNVIGRSLVDGHNIYRAEYCKDLRIYAPAGSDEVCGEWPKWYVDKPVVATPTVVPPIDKSIKIKISKGGTELADLLGM